MNLKESFSDIFSNKEVREFIIYLILVVLLVPFLVEMFIRSWNIENGILRLIAVNLGSSFISIFVIASIGFYVGNLILLFLDRMKRVQAILLLIGFVLLIYFSSHFNFYFVNWKQDITWIVPGMVLGLYLGGVIEKRNSKKREYRKAVRNISGFSVVYILSMLFNMYVIPSESITFNYTKIYDLSAFLFIFAFVKLMNYEGSSKILVLGPSQSGKSVFMLGCYFESMKITQGPLEANEELDDLFTEVNNNKTWPEATKNNEFKEYHFIYEIGNLFPKKLIIETTDYSGDNLKKIIDYVGVFKTDFENEIKKMINQGVSEVVIKQKINIYAISEKVSKSDKLILIIDSERIKKESYDFYKCYRDLVRKKKQISKDDVTQYYFVVTKCDMFLDDFEKKYSDKINSDDRINPNYGEFKKCIEKKIKEANFNLLKKETQSYDIYPVFIYTVKGEPMFDKGYLQIYGFEIFMNNIK